MLRQPNGLFAELLRPINRVTDPLTHRRIAPLGLTAACDVIAQRDTVRRVGVDVHLELQAVFTVGFTEDERVADVNYLVV